MGGLGSFIREGAHMPTRSQFRMTIVVVTLWTAAMMLPRLWAARHAAEGDRLETLADAINVAA